MSNSRTVINAGHDRAGTSLQNRIHEDFNTNENFLYATLKLLIDAGQQQRPVPDPSAVPTLRSIEELQKPISYIYRRVDDIRLRNDLYYHDLMFMLNRTTPITTHPAYHLETEHPVALHSDDHKHPYGTAQDNTRSHRFVTKCAALYPDGLSMADLGCAGGGLVLDFLLSGYRAIGLEGSDYSLRTGRAAWRLVPDHLRTCDVARPFTIRDGAGGEPSRFQLLTAWEVLEHIKEGELPQLFQNVHAHLAEDGTFAGSINCLADEDKGTGAQYHVTIRDHGWWLATFEQHGFVPFMDHPFEPYDFPRGTRNGLFDSSDYNTQPNRGFHFVMRAK